MIQTWLEHANQVSGDIGSLLSSVGLFPTAQLFPKVRPASSEKG
jgi:hypothetical protein